MKCRVSIGSIRFEVGVGFGVATTAEVTTAEKPRRAKINAREMYGKKKGSRDRETETEKERSPSHLPLCPIRSFFKRILQLDYIHITIYIYIYIHI